jgi:gliding motility-associated lipoprotein GldB
MYRSGYLIFILCLWLSGCSGEDKAAAEIEKIHVDLSVNRFDRDFANAGPEDLAALKKRFPYLFPAQYSDSVWVAKLQDTLQVELLDEVGKTFTDLEPEKSELVELFKHIRYYFPGFKVPDVVTVPSDVDYRNRVILTDSLLLIGIDNYLGPGHRFYDGIDRYIAKSLDRKYVSIDVAEAFAQKVVPHPEDRTFLAQMIYYGKIGYLKDKLLPFKSEAERMRYDEDQLAWAQANEEQIWRYFVERQVLYSTDNKLGPRFLDPAPFSKFQLELDNESPGQLGRYMGLQIVRAFMDKNKVSISQLLSLPSQEILKMSKYKPNK